MDYLDKFINFLKSKYSKNFKMYRYDSIPIKILQTAGIIGICLFYEISNSFKNSYIGSLNKQDVEYNFRIEIRHKDKEKFDETYNEILGILFNNRRDAFDDVHLINIGETTDLSKEQSNMARKIIDVKLILYNKSF